MTVLRLLGSLLLAASLVLLPTSAFAGEYPGEAEAMVVSDTNPEPCEPFDVLVEGGPSTTEVDLEAEHQAGTERSWNEDAVAGTAEFTIELCREGRWVLTAFDQDGEVLGVQAVFVGDGESGDGAGDGAGDDAGNGAARAGTGTGDSGAGIGLGDTGASSSSLLLGGAGLLLLAGGGAALLFSRRRKTQLA